MRATKDVIEAFSNRVDEFANHYLETTYPTVDDKTHTKIFREKISNNLQKVLPKWIKEFEKEYPELNIPSSVADAIYKKVEEGYWPYNEIHSKAYQKRLDIKNKLYEARKLERDTFIIHAPFIKSKEELEEYMSEVKERIESVN